VKKMPGSNRSTGIFYIAEREIEEKKLTNR